MPTISGLFKSLRHGKGDIRIIDTIVMKCSRVLRHLKTGFKVIHWTAFMAERIEKISSKTRSIFSRNSSSVLIVLETRHNIVMTASTENYTEEDVLIKNGPFCVVALVAKLYPMSKATVHIRISFEGVQRMQIREN